jgi:hypothetical protein
MGRNLFDAKLSDLCWSLVKIGLMTSKQASFNFQFPKMLRHWDEQSTTKITDPMVIVNAVWMTCEVCDFISPQHLDGLLELFFDIFCDWCLSRPSKDTFVSKLMYSSRDKFVEVSSFAQECIGDFLASPALTAFLMGMNREGSAFSALFRKLMKSQVKESVLNVGLIGRVIKFTGSSHVALISFVARSQGSQAGQVWALFGII